MIEVVIDRLRVLPGQQKLALAGASVVLVRSTGDLSPEGRGKLEAAIRESLGTHIACRFETAAELVCGVELSTDGVKLAWSVADYLSTLAQDSAALAATELAHVH